MLGISGQVASMMKRQILAIIRWHAQQRRFASATCAKLARAYLTAFLNRDYDLRQNGETWLLENLTDLSVIFDVGANRGEWSTAARFFHPGAEIHAFEIAPATRIFLRKSAVASIVHDCGLGDGERSVEFAFYPEHPDISTVVLNKKINLNKTFEMMSVPIRRGDTICREFRIDCISLLKIDVEGAEDQVLHGFSDMLGSSGIRIIQFEYGISNIFSRFLLKDFYNLLSEQYVIGKLFPYWVEFKDYDPIDEDFRGPNFVAVLKSELETISRLQRG